MGKTFLMVRVGRQGSNCDVMMDEGEEGTSAQVHMLRKCLNKIVSAVHYWASFSHFEDQCCPGQ